MRKHQQQKGLAARYAEAARSGVRRVDCLSQRSRNWATIVQLKSDAAEHLLEGGLHYVKVSIGRNKHQEDCPAAASRNGDEPIALGLRFAVLRRHR